MTLQVCESCEADVKEACIKTLPTSHSTNMVILMHCSDAPGGKVICTKGTSSALRKKKHNKTSVQPVET